MLVTGVGRVLEGDFWFLGVAMVVLGKLGGGVEGKEGGGVGIS
jgi:hypothetical protein